MRPEADIREVFRLAAAGMSQAAIARATDVSRSQVRAWLSTGEDATLRSPMSTRRDHVEQGTCALVESVPHGKYAYLLGQYLGDGYIAHNHRGVYRLEIHCCATYPNILEECAEAMAKVLPGNRVGRRKHPGVIAVGCYSKHLPCVFPQHGRGPKHERPIVLEPWQETIALVEHPELFLRGLIHSDGWRGTNRVRGANGKPYAYPRYQFSNRSEDIKALFVEACDTLGISTRRMNAYNISVARRESVALLDEFVGPKT